MYNLNDRIEERNREEGIIVFVETLKEIGQTSEFIIKNLYKSFP